MHDKASVEDLAALQAAVLRCHDQFVRMEPTPPAAAATTKAPAIPSRRR